MFDIVAIGELLIDFTPDGVSDDGVPRFLQNPGGAPANVLAAATAWGKKTAFIGKVGNDAFGSFLRDTLEDRDIDTSGLVMSKTENTTLAFVHIDASGDRTFSFYRKPGADMMLCEDEISMDVVKSCRIFHFGSVSMTHEGVRNATLAAARVAGAVGATHKNNTSGVIISFDPNYRASLWRSEEEARRVILDAIPLADILKVSSEEAEFLTGDKDYRLAAAKLLVMGPKVVLVSLGGDGSYYQIADGVDISKNTGGRGFVQSFPVSVADTTGAGDAFMGTVLAKVLEKVNVSNPVDLRSMPWEEILLYGNAAGALTATKKGAIKALPTSVEVEEVVSARVFKKDYNKS